MLLNPSTSSSISQTTTTTTTTTTNKRPKLSLQTTALPPRAYTASSISSFSPSSAHRTTSRFSFRVNNENDHDDDDDESVIPYPQPRGNIRSILRNSPYGRLGRGRRGGVSSAVSSLSANATGAETKHVFFPPRKKVRFAARLEEVIPRIPEEGGDSDGEVDAMTTTTDPSDAGDLHGKRKLILFAHEAQNGKEDTTSALSSSSSSSSSSSDDSDEWKKKRWCQKRTVTWRWTLDDVDDNNKVREDKDEQPDREPVRDIPPAPSL